MTFSHKTLKILFVVPGYVPAWAFGGVVTSMHQLAQALITFGHKVTVYTTNSNGVGGTLDVPIAKAVPLAGVLVYYFPTTNRFLNQFDSRQLSHKLKQSVRQFDIVYVAATFQWIGIATANIAAQNNVPVIMFCAGTFNKLHFRFARCKKRIWYELFLKRALDRCTALHLVGRYEQKQSLEFVKRWKHFLVPHCIDLNCFSSGVFSRAEICQTFGIDQSNPLILAAGRFDKIKRLDILINALSALRANYDFTLLIVGESEGSFASKIRALSLDLGLSERVIFAGIVAYDDMPQLYAASDLFVHLSVDENFAMVVAEAMAAGTPVIVTPGVGIWHEISSEPVGQCVNLEVNAVSNALKNFFEHRDQWAEYGKNAFDVAKQYFSPETIGKLMIQAFEDSIKNTQSAECVWFIPKGENAKHDTNS